MSVDSLPARKTVGEQHVDDPIGRRDTWKVGILNGLGKSLDVAFTAIGTP